MSRVWSLVAAPGSLVVAAEPDGALLAIAAALRRLGARITRYETESGTLEARLGDTTVCLVVRASGADRSTIRVTSEGTARSLVRRLRAELGHPSPGAAP